MITFGGPCHRHDRGRRTDDHHGWPTLSPWPVDHRCGRRPDRRSDGRRSRRPRRGRQGRTPAPSCPRL